MISEENPDNPVAALLENPSPEFIKNRWGQPDEIRKVDNYEVWRYKGDVGLVGIVALVGLPLPAVVPTGRGYTDFYIFEHKTAKVVVHDTSGKGFYYGPKSEAGGESKWRKLE